MSWVLALLLVAAGVCYVALLMRAPADLLRDDAVALEPWPDDEYTICPVCELMGRHTLEFVDRRGEVVLGPDGETVEFVTFGPRRYYVRTCAFYGDQHQWRAAYREDLS